MKLSCPYCQHENEITFSLCRNCGKQLDFTENQIGIHNLKIQLLDIKQKFDTQYTNISQRLELAERQFVFLQKRTSFLHETVLQKNEEILIKPEIEKNTEKNKNTSEIPVNETVINENDKNTIDDKSEIERILELKKYKLEQQRNKEKAEKESQQKTKQEQEQKAYERQQREQQKQQREKAKQEAAESWQADVQNFFTTTLIGTFFAPLAQFWGYLTELYAHYKEQDKLPAFFMTIGGIVALLFGFGYLMQFIADDYFEMLKIAGSAAFSTGIILVGTYLQQKEKKYHDLGAALQGLGVSINYLVIYFLSYSTVFSFVSNNPVIGTSLIIANTILAFFLALRFETKVVLVVSLFGGAFAPFYLNSNIISVFYFAYLWLLCAITVLIALQIKWKTAGTLAFLASTIVLEVVILTPSLRQFLPIGSLTIILMAFAYLFFFFALYDRNPSFPSLKNLLTFKIKETLQANDIFGLAGNAALLVTNLFNIYDGSQGLQHNLGYVYLLNAIIFLALFFLLRTKLTPKMQVLFMVIVGSFAGFAVPQLFNQNISGLFWSLEGLALVFCGFTFALADVRKEGYFVLFLGLAKIVFSFPDILTNWQLVLWTDGYVNLIYGGVVLILTLILLNKYKNEISIYEKQLAYFTLETLSFWALAVIWIPLTFFLPILSYNFMLLGVYIWIAWAYRNRLVVTEWLGLLMLGFMIMGYILSVNLVGNAVFRFQTLPAQIAAAELFLSLWFLQFFYEKILPLIPKIAKVDGIHEQNIDTEKYYTTNPESINATISTGFIKILREVFYLCLPILILPSTFRFYPNYVPLALFGSVLIAFIVAEITKRKAVKIELHILLFFATMQLFQNPTNLNITIAAILLALATLFGILIYTKGYLKDDANAIKDKNYVPLTDFFAYKLINSFTFYFVGIVVFLGVAQLVNMQNSYNFVTPLFATGLYFGVITYFKEHIVPLQSNYKFSYRLGTLLSLLGLSVYFSISLISGSNRISQFFQSQILTISILLILLIVYHIFVYRKSSSYPMGGESFVWNFDLIGVHFANILTYTILLNLFSGRNDSVWLTIAFTIHALILLFHSTAKAYNFSLKISLSLFMLALYKLYTVDMANAETPQKVIVFMVIGALMIGSALLFTKFKEKKQD